MKHLTVDEIIDFVSFDRIDSETLAMAASVNSHIRNCNDCMRKVRAFQLVYDELSNHESRSAMLAAAREIVEKEASSRTKEADQNN